MINIKDINLLPEEFYAKEYKKRNTMFRALLFLLFCIILAYIYIETTEVRARYESKINLINTKVNNDVVVKESSKFKDVQNTVISLKEAVNQIKKDRIDWPAILNDIALIIPQNVSIVNFIADEKGIKLSGEAKSAEDVALFIRNLKSLDYIYEIKPVSIGEENRGILSFNLIIDFKVAPR